MSTKRFISKNGLDNNNQTITNVADPINSSDAATKNITDSISVRSNSSFNVANSASANSIYLSGVSNTINSNIVTANAYTQTLSNRTFTFYQNTSPSSANTRDQWVNCDTGVLYENFGNSSFPVWAEVGPTGNISNTSPGIVSAIQVNVSNNITVSGGATVVNNTSTNKYINIGQGQLFDDGNFHVHTSSGSLWLNSLDGGDINLGLQTNSGSSKAVANNISLNAGYGSVAPIYGVRAWINCGWNGSSMVTRGGGNLSVSRGSTGVYNFTFGTSMPDGNYSVSATAQTPGTNSDCAVNITNGTTPSSTGFSLTVARYGNGNEDTPILHVQVVR